MSGKSRNIWVVVLAGGDGQRLRALTTNARGISTKPIEGGGSKSFLRLLVPQL
jgi:hypothetical protein